MENWKYSVNSINTYHSHPSIHQIFDSPSFPHVVHVLTLSLRKITQKSHQSEDQLWAQHLQMMHYIREHGSFYNRFRYGLFSSRNPWTKRFLIFPSSTLVHPHSKCDCGTQPEWFQKDSFSKGGRITDTQQTLDYRHSVIPQGSCCAVPYLGGREGFFVRLWFS